MNLRALLFLPLVIFFGASLAARSVDAMGPKPPARKPWLMGILGDSIAAGTLADVPIPFAPTPEESVQAWHDQGLEPQFLYTNKKTLSWGSGQKIRSHFVLLQEWLRASGVNRSLEVANVSHPGDETGHLRGQVDQLLGILREGRHEGLGYVALTIGSNDACHYSRSDDVPVERIRQNLVEALAGLAKGARQILKQSEPIRVMLIGAPRIPNLGAPGFVAAPTLFGLSCSLVRDRILKYCNPLTVWSGLDEYLARLSVVETVNGVMKSVALEMDGEFPDLEIVYSDRLFQLEIPLAALAADCFHPGRWAQEQISQQTWKDQPWFQ